MASMTLLDALNASLTRTKTYIDTELAKKADSSHTHNYAGSSSAGGAANSVKTNLIIKLNGGSTEGTNLFTFNGSTAKTVNITPSAIGAAPTSHASTATTYGVSSASNYGHAMASSTTPKANGTAAVGSETAKFARGDHVHPLQTTVSGNAGTATKFASSQSVALTGDVTGSASSQAGWSVATTLANSGVTAGSYGPSANASPAHKGTFSVPYITVDAKGRVTAASTKTITLPSDNNTDTKVNTTLATTTKAYLLGTSTTPTSTAAAVTTVSDTGVYLDTTAGQLTATTFKGALSGNATTATTLATARTIAISGGATGTATSFNGSANISIPITAVKESYLSWGGKNFSGSYGPIDAAMVPHLGANRLAFMPAAGVDFEYSRDGGSTWTAYSSSDTIKINFFNGNGATRYIGADSTTKIDKANYMFRVTITASTAKVYTVLNKFVIYCSTNGSSGSYCSIDARTQANVTAGTDTWVNFANKVSISGWSGYNVINTSGITVGTNSSQYGQLRFTFGVTSHANTVEYAGLNVSMVMGFGGVGWTTPSTMAAKGRIYNYDASQNVIFPAGVTATSFTENGTALSSKYAAASHTHNYAGSSSAGGAATSANKVNTDLIVKLNSGTTEGTNLFTFNGSTAKTVNITPSAIGAAPTSHASTATTYGAASASNYGHAMASSTTPKANGTAAVGSETAKFARGDHVHPLQTTVSGNAGTATKFASAQSVALTGDVTGSASSQAGWSVATTLANSGVTAGSYGPSANASPAHSGTFSVPYITVDAKGRVTSASTKTITLPSDNNTDTKVTNTLATTTKAYVTGTTTASTNTGTQVFDTGVYLDTTAGQLTATTFKGALSGNATTATTLATARTLTIGSTGKTFNGSANVSWSLSEIGAAASSHTHTSVVNQDTRAVDTTPNDAPLGLSVHLKYNGTDSLSDGGTYHSSLFIKGWNDYSGGPYGNIAISANNNLWYRASSSATAWNSWKKVSVDGHTHNYAGSSSAGGAATSANKVNTSLIIKLNSGSTEGTNLFTFNGSTAKTVNITPSAIGAAAMMEDTELTTMLTEVFGTTGA